MSSVLSFVALRSSSRTLADPSPADTAVPSARTLRAAKPSNTTAADARSWRGTIDARLARSRHIFDLTRRSLVGAIEHEHRESRDADEPLLLIGNANFPNVTATPEM